MTRAAVPGLVGDPGAQPQRTSLAHQRTSLSVVVVAVACAVNALRVELPVVTALALLVAPAACVGILVTGTRGSAHGRLLALALQAAALAGLGTVVSSVIALR